MTYRMTIGSILLVAAWTSAPAALSQQKSEVANQPATEAAHLLAPDTLTADRNSLPFWISASAATSAASGEINYDAFGAGLRDAVRSQAIPVTHSASSASAGESCGQFTVSFNEGAPKAMATWRDAVVNAAGIVKGTITAVSPGFLSTAPATMLTVRINETLRDNDSLRGVSELYIPFMGADFKIGSARFCNAGLSRNGESFLPAVNDDVLIFVFDAPRDHYLSARDENLFFGRNDRLYVPTIFGRDASLPEKASLKALMARVRLETRGSRFVPGAKP